MRTYALQSFRVCGALGAVGGSGARGWVELGGMGLPEDGCVRRTDAPAPGRRYITVTLPLHYLLQGATVHAGGDHDGHVLVWVVLVAAQHGGEKRRHLRLYDLVVVPYETCLGGPNENHLNMTHNTLVVVVTATTTTTTTT